MRRIGIAVVLAVGVFGVGLLAAGMAFGGNIYLTGHDLDLHCNDSADQCNALGIAMDIIRAGAPDPTLPVLVLDERSEVKGALSRAATEAQNKVQGAGNPFPIDVVNAAGFGTATLSTSDFSAIVFASDASCGGCDNGPADITAMNHRTADIQSFFNAGGGLLYLAGAEDRATYYNSVPVPASAKAVTEPFTVTPFGLGLGAAFGNAPGLIDLPFSGDDNCCATHNSFTVPDPSSPLQVAELDSARPPLAETLVGIGASIGGGGFTGGGTPGPTTSVPEPASAFLLGSALLGLVGVRRIRRKTNI
jgi:hypothetical protein